MANNEAFSLTWVHCDTLQLTRKGDVVLTLDSGEAYPAHSLYLRHRSAVLAEAIAVGSLKERPLRVPIPGTTSQELLVLLQTIYSPNPQKYLDGLRSDCVSLWTLAKVCHKLDCQDILQQADALLSQNCGLVFGSHAQAVQQYADSQQWGLTATNAAVTSHLCANIREVSFQGAHNIDLTPVLSKVAPRCLTVYEGFLLQGRTMKVYDWYNSITGGRSELVGRIERAADRLQAAHFSVTRGEERLARMRDNHVGELRNLTRSLQAFALDVDNEISSALGGILGACRTLNR